jgi:GH24 family phage-related lysozyme (muramidase)
MVNRQPRSPGDLARYAADPLISTDVPSYAVDTGQASRALASVAGSLSDTLGKLADRAAQREGQLAGLTEGQAAGASYLQAQQAAAQAGGAAGVGPWEEQAKALIRKEEGFRDKPYHDVNAYRVGYGSDTIVTADGKVVPVTQGMQISQDDAERDLSYRIANREGAQVRKQLGPAFDALPDSAKAVVTSVGYNYGSLPPSVVKAAQTGDVEQLAASVEGLDANPGRRKREAAIIRGGALPSSPGADPASNTYQAPVVPTAPLALRRDGTIRGDAMDDAAISAYSWRMQAGLSTDLFNAAQQFQDDPGGFTQASQKIRDQYAQAIPQDPQMRETFDKAFVDRTEAYRQNIAARHQTQIRNEQEASYASGLDAQRVDLERQSQVLGANPNGDEIIGKQVRTIQNSIDGAIAAGTITPAQGETAKQNIAETAARGRIQGVYDALPSDDQKEQYSLAILDDWKTGKGPLAQLPFASVKAISDTLRRDALERKNHEKAQNKVEAVRVSSLIDDDVTSLQTTGKGLDPAQSGLTAERVQTLLGDAGLTKWQAGREKAGRVYDATNGMETQSAEDLTQRLAAIEPKPGTPGYAENLEIYEAAQKQASAVIKARAQDPAAVVDKAFPDVKKAAAAADPQDPSSMQTLVTTRLHAQQALGISDFEQAPLTKTEAIALSKPISAQPDPGLASKAMMDLVTQVNTTYGAHADKVLSQVLQEQGISKDMATLGAGYFRRLERGQQPTGADRRQGQVINETSAADNSGSTTPRTFGPVGPSADPTQVVPSAARQSATMADVWPIPNYLQMQRLQQNPQLSSQFDAKFGPGASSRVLGPPVAAPAQRR